MVVFIKTKVRLTSFCFALISITVSSFIGIGFLYLMFSDRKSGEIDFRDFNPITFRGFHENRAIHFFNLRLSDIAEDLERLFGVKTVILDEKLAETRYFALFTNNESLDQILKGIDMEDQMVFNRKENVIYISRK